MNFLLPLSNHLVNASEYMQHVCSVGYHFTIRPFSATLKITNLPCFVPFSAVSHILIKEMRPSIAKLIVSMLGFDKPMLELYLSKRLYGLHNITTKFWERERGG